MGKQKKKSMSLYEFQQQHQSGNYASNRSKGIISEISDRGFGKITYEKSKKIFFHFNDVDKKDRIVENAEVEFEIDKGKKGLAAKRVKILNVHEGPNNNFSGGKMPKYHIPDDTLKNLESDKNWHEKIDNFALKFHKYPQFDGENFLFYRTDRKKGNIDDIKDFNFDENKIKVVINNLKNIAETLYPNTNSIFEMNVDWRLAVGLGNESVYETSMTLHPVYGIPYIPGQGVKGIVRSWIINDKFEQNEGRAISESKAFCKMFGCSKEVLIDERDGVGNLIKDKKGNVKKENYKSNLGEDYQGSIVFFDAFPINLTSKSLKVDIMNPHYGPYYSDTKGQTPPADYHNPKPIPFLTVENTSFQFIIGIKEKNNEQPVDDEKLGKGTLLELTKKYLKEALQNQGIGAKTAVGYGYFS